MHELPTGPLRFRRQVLSSRWLYWRVKLATKNGNKDSFINKQRLYVDKSNPGELQYIVIHQDYFFQNTNASNSEMNHEL